MAVTYKRTIIQIPLEDVSNFESYAKKYSLSVSGAIILLAKKAMEYEETLKYVPDMITIMKKDLDQKPKKKIAKKK